MDRVGEAGRFLAKPRQRPLAARSVSRHKDDPGAHFRELFGSDLSDAGGGSRNDNRLPLHENTPAPYGALPLGPGSAGFRSCNNARPDGESRLMPASPRSGSGGSAQRFLSV